MNTELIPQTDMLGLPGPAWVFQSLMALTLALHWLFIGLSVGGTFALLLGLLKPTDESGPINRSLASLLPFCLAMAMTLGIAPLLFVQVLYGNFFYTSNLLMGFLWLAIVPLVIAAFYLLWHAWSRLTTDRPLNPLVPILTLLVLILVGFTLSSNATLTQTPTAWQTVQAKGDSYYVADPTFMARLLFALSGFAAVGGLFAAIVGRVKFPDTPAGRSPRLVPVLAALGLQLLFGIWLVAALPADHRAVLTGGAEAIFFYLAVAAYIAAVPLVFVAMKSPSIIKLIAPVVAQFVGLLGVALARDAVRRAALAPYHNLADMPVHAQWGHFAVFLIVFVAGLGVIAYSVKLSREPLADAA